jgi:hypothetical protein
VAKPFIELRLFDFVEFPHGVDPLPEGSAAPGQAFYREFDGNPPTVRIITA